MFSQNLSATSTSDEIIRNQDVIRVFFDEKRGSGDLAASFKVMEGIRDLYDFDGVFEAIVPDNAWHNVKSLFDLPAGNLPTNTHGVEYDWKGNKVVFIKVSTFIKQHDSMKTVKFGFSGSFLYTYAWVQTDQEKSQLDNKSLLSLMKVQCFIDTTPWVGSAPYFPRVITANTTYHLTDKKSYVQTTSLAFSDAKAHLNKSAGLELVKTHPALTPFMAGMEQKKFNVMPVYGWAVTVKNNMLYFDQTEDVTPANILSIIYAARYAQLNGAQELRNKPLVIPVFYEYADDIQLIKDVIYHNKWDEKGLEKLNDRFGADTVEDVSMFINDKNKRITQFIKTFKLVNAQAIKAIQNATDELGIAKPNVFAYADGTKVDSVQAINNLAPNTILLLSLPSLPRTVFEGIFSYTGSNMLPPWREGPGLFYQLATTGKPHFRCGNVDAMKRWEPGFDAVEDLNLKTQLDTLYELKEKKGPWDINKNMGLCNGMHTWEANGRIHQTLGELIIASRDPQSTYSKYFQALGKDVQKPEYNRIRLLVDKALNESSWALAPILTTEQQNKVDEEIMQELLRASSYEAFKPDVPFISPGEKIGYLDSSLNQQPGRFSAITGATDPVTSIVAIGIGSALAVASIYLVIRDLLKSDSVIKQSVSSLSSSLWSKPQSPEYQTVPNKDLDLEAGNKPAKKSGIPRAKRV